MPGEFDPSVIERPNRVVLPEAPTPSLSTTLVVIATNATLTKARCAKLAAIAHDGLARAIRPVHTMFDGDTAFAISTESGQRLICSHFTRCWMWLATASASRSLTRC